MLISPDVSYYQAKVDDSFNRQWLIFRGCDGGYMDENAAHNAAWCRNAKNQGRLLGHTTYVVYRPGENAAILNNLAKLGPLDRLMVDIETWYNPKTNKKAISGDHSGEINSLILDLDAIYGDGNVWRYGNLGDLNEVHPHPLPGQLTVVADYEASRPNVANLIGWQYTNGTENHTINPSSTPPFGNCDHNEIYVDELAPSGGGIPIPAPAPAPVSTEDDEMFLAQVNPGPNGEQPGIWLVGGPGGYCHMETPSDVASFKNAGVKQLNINYVQHQRFLAAEGILA